VKPSSLPLPPSSEEKPKLFIEKLKEEQKKEKKSKEGNAKKAKGESELPLDIILEPPKPAFNLMSKGAEASSVNPSTDRISFAVPVSAYDPATVHSIYRPQRKKDKYLKRLAFVENYLKENGMNVSQEEKEELIKDEENLPLEKANDNMSPPTYLLTMFNYFTLNWVAFRGTEDEAEMLGEYCHDKAWSTFASQHNSKHEELAHVAMETELSAFAAAVSKRDNYLANKMAKFEKSQEKEVEDADN
jgi:hypothetical protein